jgi:S1-C subfamily serine protease
MKTIFILIIWTTFLCLDIHSQSFVFCPSIEVPERNGLQNTEISIVFKDSRTYEKKLKENCQKSDIFYEFANYISQAYPKLKLTFLDESLFSEDPKEGKITLKINLIKYDATFKLGTYNSITKFDVEICDYRNEQNKIEYTFIGQDKQWNTSGFINGKIASNNSFRSAFIKFLFELDKIKIEFPQNGKNIVSSSGTGFCISSKGIIVTNYHVIENAKTIKVRGVNSNYSKTYNAKVLVSDKNNDLSIIQIDDEEFTSVKGSIPYSIKTDISKVGESTFVLGYPLRATMGDEIKLTNGIISSLTGFQGDAGSYQISAPIQPGNSGGPLIDNKGNVIGIINAKHLGAENVSYAIKTNYLKNLIDLIDQSYVYNPINPLKDKQLTEQVELVKSFVYIIEIDY